MPPKGWSLLQRNLPGIFWTAIILLLMGIPGSRIPEIKGLWEWLKPDKVVHLLLFGVWAYLIIRQNSQQYRNNPRGFFVIAALMGVFFAALTEVLQELMFVNRSGSIYDFLANLVGLIFGLIIYGLINRKKSDRP